MGILVNGNGNPHVYAHQDSDLIAGIVGNQTSIMPVGDKFEANQEDANTIALSSGVIITKEGRRIQLDAGTIDEFIIPTGTQDVQSFYIIGYHLYEDGNSDQLCETFVRKMESASDTIPESTFRSGATEVYVSLYRVTQDSLNITDIDLLLPYADSIAEVKRNGGNKNLAAIEDGSTASQPYVKGEFVIVGGQFCEVTASISTNDAFIAYPLPNYNIKAGTVGEQITALNQNLTNCCIWNPTDDWIYINGEKWKKAYKNSLVFFNMDSGFNAEDFGSLDTSTTYSGSTAAGYTPTTTAIIQTENINMYVQQKSGGSTGHFGEAIGKVQSHKYIDLTQYTKLFVNGHLYWSGDVMSNKPTANAFTVSIVNAQTSVETVLYTENKPSSGGIHTDKELELDLTQYSGNYYILFKFGVASENYAERMTKFEASNVYLS